MKPQEFIVDEAIDAAIHQNWELAIEKNKAILKIKKEDIDTFLRLGFAYLQINSLEEAKKYYKKALKLQPQHQVARENYERITILEKKGGKKVNKSSTMLDPNIFLDIPGKTKNISLVNVGQKQSVAQVSIGEEVFLKPKSHRIEFRTHSDAYLGSLPDDISKRILYFLKAKSEYHAYVKEASLNRVVVFIRETVLGKKVNHLASFPTQKNQPYNTPIDQVEKDEAQAEAEEPEEPTEFEKILNDLGEVEKEDHDLPIDTSHEDEEE